MSSRPALVVLAAGMGRRFGGLKQLAPVGPRGEAIVDYSARDALVAGFDRIVLVIRPEIEPAMREHLARRWPGRVPVTFTMQQPDPATGEPRGTADAVLAAAGEVGDDPFAVVNADDYYGPGTFVSLARHLREDAEDHALVGFRLADTVPGSAAAVRRALCAVSGEGYLLGITESEVRPAGSGSAGPGTSGVAGEADPGLRGPTGAAGAAGKGPHGEFVAEEVAAARGPRRVPGSQLVSMNAWGFRPTMWAPLRSMVEEFLAGARRSAGAGEVLLPDAVDRLMRQGERIRVLQAVDRWCGLTWADDLAAVRSTLAMLRFGREGDETLDWPL